MGEKDVVKDIAEKESDLVQIKEELILAGYIRRKGGNCPGFRR